MLRHPAPNQSPSPTLNLAAFCHSSSKHLASAHCPTAEILHKLEILLSIKIPFSGLHFFQYLLQSSQRTGQPPGRNPENAGQFLLQSAIKR